MRLRLPADRNWLVLLAVLLLATVAYFGMPNSRGYRGGIAELDGYYYYVYLRSLQMDGDIELGNDYREWGNPFHFERTATGYHRNVFGVGPAILWAPFFLLACGLARLGVAAGLPLSLDGLSPLHQTVTFYGTLLYGWVALLVCYAIARRCFGREHALWPTLGAALAGPLPFYCLTWASYSHAQAALATSVLILLWLRWREEWTLRRWVLWGAASGLVLLVRPACVAFLLLPLYEGARQLLSALRGGGSGQARLARAAAGPALGALAALLVFAPQLWAWKVLFGHWLVVPQGEGFMLWGQNAWASTLFSPRNGLLTAAPLMLFALVGLGLALRAMPATAGPLLLVLAGVLAVNGAVHDWWGWGFSARRFTSSLPIFAFGLASCLRRCREWLARDPARAIARGTALVILLAIVFNLQWMVSFATRNLDWYHVRSTEGLYMTVTHGLVDRLFGAVGNPLSAPLSVPFAWRRGGSPRVYDRVDGSYLLGEAHPGANPGAWPLRSATLDLGDLRFRYHLSDDFGTPQGSAEARYAPLRGPRGHVFLPLNRPGDLQLRIEGRALHQGTRLEVLFNGEPVGRGELSTGRWSRLSLSAPARLVERGINRLDLVHHLPPLPAPERCLALGPGRKRCCRADVAAISGGARAGTFAEIWVDEERVAPSWGGLNLAVLEPASGRLLGARGFDDSFCPSVYRHAADYLRRFPAGSLVAFAVRGDPLRLYHHGGSQTLALFGATGRGLAREAGYAAMGFLGAPAGTALEAAAVEGHARVHLGRPPPPWREVAHYRVIELR